MEGNIQNESNSSEFIENHGPTTKINQEIKKDLLNDLSKIESENSDNIGEKIPDVQAPKPYVCPDRLLNAAQSFPTALQKVILTSNLTKDQRKAVEGIFKANQDELEINRAIMKRIIESLCNKIPALQSVINEDAILIMQWCLTLRERSAQMDLVLEQQGAK